MMKVVNYTTASPAAKDSYFMVLYSHRQLWGLSILLRYLKLYGFFLICEQIITQKIIKVKLRVYIKWYSKANAQGEIKGTETFGR